MKVTARIQPGAILLLAGLCPLLAGLRPAAAEEVSVKAAVEKTDVFAGEAFLFQIQVNGSDSPAAPDLSHFTDFDVESLGGRNRNSESVTIINGRMSRVVNRGYVFNYRLTPRRTGTLIIPAVDVPADGKTLKTQPIRINAKEPAETDDFKLRLELSKTTCYAGEAVILTVTWYLGKDVRGFDFNLPVLSDARLEVDDPERQIDPTQQYYRVPMGNSEAVARKGQGTLDGRSFTTLSFQKVLIPRQPGRIQLPAATVSCEALVGRRDPRSRSRGGLFPDDFFGIDRGVYEKFVVPSNALALEVKPLPAKGRPAGFAGHVGEYSIRTTAAPTEVNVGDPITLTITLSGPPYLKNVELPPLKQQPALARDFKIPEEMAAGKIEDHSKVFTQTIRALRSDVTEIPPTELAYFDTKDEAYRVARSQAIPITVHATRVVTARDAEGRETSALKSELEALREGIAHNYEDLSVLEDQEYGLATVIQEPLWVCAIGLPPVLYFLLLATSAVIRRRNADPDARQARRAYADLARTLKRIRSGQAPSADAAAVLDALRTYLGHKLRLTGAAITCRDVEPALAQHGVPQETIDAIRALFQECEAAQYAGADGGTDESAALAGRALDLMRSLERRLP